MTTGEANSDDSPIYLALGSNLGDREANLREALERLAARGLLVTRRSSIYETEPVGFADQGWFLNQAVEAEMPRELMFDLSQQDVSRLGEVFGSNASIANAFQCGLLLRELFGIEAEMGRRREVINGPRVIDIDVLLCDRLAGVFDSTRPGAVGQLWREHRLPELSLPHPRMHLRRFVLALLCEIAPAVIHPTSQRTCAELLAALDDRAVVRLYRGAA